MARSSQNDTLTATLSPIGGKVPPQNIEAEQSILGAILIDPEAMIKVTDKIKADDFYREDHKTIFEHMLKLFEKRQPIDILTLTDSLESSKKLTFVGGATYIATLTGFVNSSAHITTHAEIVRNKAMLRRIIQAGSKIMELGFKEDSESQQILSDAEASLFGVSNAYLRNNFVPIGMVLSESFDRIDEIHRTKGQVRGVPTGFKDLDNLLGGLQKSDLVILAARPSMGKCVTGDTTILDPKTGRLRTIKDIVAGQDGHLVSLSDTWQWQNAQPSHYVADGIKPTFKVVTALGQEIEATLPHPFLAVTGWKKLGELSVGDRIAVASELPYFGRTHWPDYKVKALAYFLTDGSVTKTTPGFTNSNPVIVTDFKQSMLAFGGVAIREETSHGTRAASYYVSVSRDYQQSIRAQWADACRNYLSKQAYSARHIAQMLSLSPSTLTHWQQGTAQVSAKTFPRLHALFPDFPVPVQFDNANPVREFLTQEQVWGKTAAEKVIPEAVFTFTRPKLALFLNRLFACDGTAWMSQSGKETQGAVGYCSVSKTLVYQVQHLLRRFGIVAKVRTKQVAYKGERRTAYELEIHGREAILRFADEIGIHGKEKALNQLREYMAGRKKGWTNDTLPQEVWSRILEKKGARSWRSIYASVGLPLSHNIHANRWAPRRETVLTLAKALDDHELENMANSAVYWDRIISIEPTGMKEVYDLTVPQTHNFVANDFVVHNTAFVLNIAENAAVKSGSKVAIFSLEQSKDQLVDRLLCSQAGVDSWKLRTGNLTDEDFPRIGQAMGVLSEAPIFIDDTPGLTALEIRTKSRRLQMEQGLDLIIIDYLQLMTGRTSENRTQEISEISRSLKGIARELNVPVIALSQLSRAVEQRPDKRPMLSDLRESGAIEQDADVVMFIYRDEYYNQKDTEKPNIAEILVRKHRNGPVGEVDLYFQGEQTRFRNLDKRHS